jgi:hypothetical protein
LRILSGNAGELSANEQANPIDTTFAVPLAVAATGSCEMLITP